MLKNVLVTMTIICAMLPAYAAAQDAGRIVFTDPKSKDDKLLTEEDLAPRAHAWGGDIMIGTDGFGLGFFYSYAFNDVLSSFANISLTEAKDNNQRDYIDPYFGQISPYKVNYVFRVPLFFGLQYRLFKDDIVENFRPFINGGAGPVLLFVSPVDGDMFSSLFGGGTSHYTFGGFVGAGAQFGFDRSSIFGVNIRYMIIPVPDGISGVGIPDQDNPEILIPTPLDNANGFYIAINFGTTF
ncbi:MAG: outer membrane beta-barrel protein [Bacteroidetes bacterium]|nr:outer membrane beta-barrel protein [Bacteroidota bacterium]